MTAPADVPPLAWLPALDLPSAEVAAGAPSSAGKGQHEPLRGLTLLGRVDMGAESNGDADGCEGGFCRVPSVGDVREDRAEA
jgi:hypothetical protein